MIKPIAILLGFAVVFTFPFLPMNGDKKGTLDMNSVAEAYVKLVLAVGEHDPDYVDAFYGPAEWRDSAEKEKQSLESIKGEAENLRSQLEQIGSATRLTEMGYLRLQYLTKQLQALNGRVEMLGGKRFTFDEEAEVIYDVIPPTYTEEHFAAILAELEAMLPEGNTGATAQERLEIFRSQFIIPPDKLDIVFQAAIDECRERTLEHLSLPANESFTIEYVTDKAWSGYNWYQGDGRSLIQINTDLPIYIERAVDLAAHEGYPGHHVYNAMLEKNLARELGWVEFMVYPLFSPQSLIAEGSANFGKQVVFTRPERLRFEREVLFPLAGLDSARVEEYYDVLDLTDKLDYAGNEAARQYLDGRMGKEKAIDWLMKYRLMSYDRAEQRVRFIEKYRSYVINYNLGQDMVREYIEARVGTEDNPAKRWEEFSKLLASPRLPSGLK